MPLLVLNRTAEVMPTGGSATSIPNCPRVTASASSRRIFLLKIVLLGLIARFAAQGLRARSMPSTWNPVPDQKESPAGATTLTSHWFDEPPAGTRSISGAMQFGVPQRE